MLIWNVFVIKYYCSLSGGLTPLHAAVLSHNAVVKELRSLGNPCSYIAMELVQRRQMFVECIQTLLLMGASFGTKVTIKTTGEHQTLVHINTFKMQSFLKSYSKIIFLLYFPFPQDLKSGRTCLHMASEGANVELLNIFLDQPSSLSVVNIKVSCFVVTKSCNTQAARTVMCDSTSVCFRRSVETRPCTLSALCKAIKVKWTRWSCWWGKEPTPGTGTLRVNCRLSWCLKGPLVKR